MLGCRWAALNATNGEMASVSMHSRGIRPLPDYVTGKPVAPRQMTLPKRACSNSATIADRKTGIGKHATRRTAKSLPLACLDRQRWSKSASVQAVSPVLLSRAGSTSTIQQIRPCSSGESRSGADLAGVEDALRNRVEQRTPAFEGGRLAARHNQKIPCLRAFHAARHWRVQHGDTSGGQHVVDPPDEQGGIRCVVDVEPTRLNNTDDTAWTEADLLHLCRSRQASGNDFAFRG